MVRCNCKGISTEESIKSKCVSCCHVKFNSFLFNRVMEQLLKHLQMKMGEEDIHELLEVDTVCA